MRHRRRDQEAFQIEPGEDADLRRIDHMPVAAGARCRAAVAVARQRHSGKYDR